MTEQKKTDGTRTHQPCIRWCWVRHAPSLVEKGVFTGKSDVPARMDAAQRKSVAELARTLPLPHLVVSSALTRARQTAQRITEGITEGIMRGDMKETHENRIEQKIDAALDEQNFGDWEGQPYDELHHRALWLAPATCRPPNGESFQDLAQRVECAIERIENALRTRADFEADSIVVVAVAHAGTVRAALASALSLSLEGALSFVVDPLSLTLIERYKIHEKTCARVCAVNVRTHHDMAVE